MEIEMLFAALKSRGDDLERTHLAVPDRNQRLIGLLALAFGWMWLIGLRRANREGFPREKSHERQHRSLNPLRFSSVRVTSKIRPHFCPVLRFQAKSLATGHFRA